MLINSNIIVFRHILLYATNNYKLSIGYQFGQVQPFYSIPQRFIETLTLHDLKGRINDNNAC